MVKQRTGTFSRFAFPCLAKILPGLEARRILRDRKSLERIPFFPPPGDHMSTKYTTSIETTDGTRMVVLTTEARGADIDIQLGGIPANLTAAGLCDLASWLARIDFQVSALKIRLDREDLIRLRNLAKEEVEKRLIREEKAIFSSSEPLGQVDGMKLLIKHEKKEGLRLVVIEHVDVPLILPEVSTWYEDDGVQHSRINSPEDIEASGVAQTEALGRARAAAAHPIHLSFPTTTETLVVTDVPEVTVRARAPGLLLFETRITLMEDITSEVAIQWELSGESP